jgi:putative ABC transport system permease protein
VPTVVPGWVVVGSIILRLIIGAAAGLLPAIRAARVSPVEALAAA